MKFTKKAFRAALKANDKTKVWQLAAVKLGKTPTRAELKNFIWEMSTTRRDDDKAYDLAYNTSTPRKIRFHECEQEFIRRNDYENFKMMCARNEKTTALEMLRRLLTEKPSNYTKVPMMGHTHLYFCSPSYGHADYNKVRTCNIEGNEIFCKKVVDIGERILAKKSA